MKNIGKENNQTMTATNRIEFLSLAIVADHEKLFVCFLLKVSFICTYELANILAFSHVHNHNERFVIKKIRAHCLGDWVTE